MFVDRCQMLQEALDTVAITTDVIVGFPGETEDDFEASCQVARQVGFSKIHVFPFSPRRGTPAADMSDQIAAPVKADRVARLSAVEAELRQDYFQRLVGKRVQVLVEARVANVAGVFTGSAFRYAPVEFPATPEHEGQLMELDCHAALDDRIRAR